MLRFRELTTEQEFVAFKDGYESNLRRRSDERLQCTVPLEYVATSRAVGCFDGRGQMVAGFIMRYEGPLRCVSAVPKHAQDVSPLLWECDGQDLCELTCIWRSKGISHTAFALVVWPKIIADCVSSGRKYILGLGFNNTMNDIYRICRPVQVYAGPSAAAETNTQVFIYAYTRHGIALTYVTNFWDRMMVLPVKRLGRSLVARLGSSKPVAEVR